VQAVQIRSTIVPEEKSLDLGALRVILGCIGSPGRAGRGHENQFLERLRRAYSAS